MLGIFSSHNKAVPLYSHISDVIFSSTYSVFNLQVDNMNLGESVSSEKQVAGEMKEFPQTYHRAHAGPG